MRMWEFSAEDRQKPFHRPQVYADKFEQAFTNKANAALLDPAQYMCFPGDGTTFKKIKYTERISLSTMFSETVQLFR